VELSFYWDAFDIEGLSWKLYNILKGLSALLTVYLDTKYCRLEQCNGPTLATKSCKGNGGRVGLSFHWDAFGIEVVDEDKMVSSSFGGVALGDSQPTPPCEDTSPLGCPALVLGQT
jgi:hypothetical protein